MSLTIRVTRISRLMRSLGEMKRNSKRDFRAPNTLITRIADKPEELAPSCLKGSKLVEWRKYIHAHTYDTLQQCTQYTYFIEDISNEDIAYIYITRTCLCHIPGESQVDEGGHLNTDIRHSHIILFVIYDIIRHILNPLKLEDGTTMKPSKQAQRNRSASRYASQP